MDFSNCNIGYGITGSFCTFAKTRKEVVQLTEMGANVIPIFSYQAQSCDTRFGSAKEFVEGICEITGNEGIKTMQQAEPIGPNNFLDIRQSCATELRIRRYSWRPRRTCATENLW